MTNKKLIKCFLESCSKEQLVKVLEEVINHYILNEEYRVDSVIDNIINIATENEKVDNYNYDKVLVEHKDIFTDADDDVKDVHIVGTDRIDNTFKIQWYKGNYTYPYVSFVDIDKLRSLVK